MPKGAVRGLLLVVIALAMLAALRLSWPDDGAPVVAPNPAAANVGSAIDPVRAQSDREPAAVPTEAPAAATATSTARPADASLRVRLRGLHPLAPWTAELHLDLDGALEPRLEHSATAKPGTDGAACFALPAWWSTTTRCKERITASDPNYAPLAFRQDELIDTSSELVLDVQVVANLTGRVVDAANQPVPAARVSTFALRENIVSDRVAAATNTDTHGNYRLRVPPDVPLLIVAVAMNEAAGSRLATSSEDGLCDNGDPRSDLLPAATQALAHVATPTPVADLVLIAAANVTGTVRWHDGTPVELATVTMTPRGGTPLRIDELCLVHRLPDDRLAPALHIDTDQDGTFTLPGVPGIVVDVAITALPEASLLGDLEPRAATPPQRLELFLPPIVTLRALAGEQPEPQARIEFANGNHVPAGADGRLQVIAANPFRVRASRERRQSPWLDVVPAATGAEIQLQLAEALQPVTIEFEGDYRVRNTVLTWRRDDQHTGREHLLRDDRGGPFRIFLEPGHYHLVAGPGDGERYGVYLLPVEREFDVAAVPVALVLPAVFGGTFVVHATDASGLYVTGTCFVSGSDGKDRTATFHRADGGRDAARGRAGELLAGGPGEYDGLLPPGTYELQFDFPEHGTQLQRVTIRPREVTDVRLRLP